MNHCANRSGVLGRQPQDWRRQLEEMKPRLAVGLDRAEFERFADIEELIAKDAGASDAISVSSLIDDVLTASVAGCAWKHSGCCCPW